MTDQEKNFLAIISKNTGTPKRELAMKERYDDLGYDSLDVLSLILAMEDEYDISIEDSAVTDTKTIQQLYDLVTEKLRVRPVATIN